MNNIILEFPKRPMHKGTSGGSVYNTPIHERLSSVFSDAIVLDMTFTIQAASPGILHELGYCESDVLSKTFTCLSPEVGVEDDLRQRLAPGFFQDYSLQLTARCGRKVIVTLSGFYLHLLNDIGGYIVLRVSSLEELELTRMRLQQKTEELEHFVYRASHDLRGPIATIKGLINLANIRKDDREVNVYFDLIAMHAEKLDQELRGLIKKIQPITQGS